MEPPVDDRFTLSALELAALGVIVGEPLLIGIDDPFTDPTLDRAALFADGRRSLIERGLIASINGRDLILPVLLPIAYTIFYPDATYVCAAFDAATRREVERTFHLQGDLAIRITELGDDRYRLDPIDGLAALEDHLAAIWNLGAYEADLTAATIELPWQLLVFGGSTDELVAAGVSETDAPALGAALHNADRRGHLLALSRGDLHWHSGAIGFLAQGARLWQVTPLEHDGAPRVALAPADDQRLLDEMSELVVRMAFAGDEDETADEPPEVAA